MAPGRCWCTRFPAADVPVVQLSLDGTQPPGFHYELAKKLAPLRDAGVLIVGCGNVVHNLARIRWTEDAAPYDRAVRFNDKLRAHVAAHEHGALVNFASLGGGRAPERAHARALPAAPLRHRAAGPRRGHFISH
jgi:aromatic ring-opening dioxygenase catalytic subunit (LigB family)